MSFAVFRQHSISHNCWAMANRLDMLNRRLSEHGLNHFFDEPQAANAHYAPPRPLKASFRPFDLNEIAHALAVLFNGLCLAMIVFAVELLCKRYGWPMNWMQQRPYWRRRQ